MKQRPPFSINCIKSIVVGLFAVCLSQLAQAQSDTTYIIKDSAVKSNTFTTNTIQPFKKQPANEFVIKTFKTNVSSLGLKNYHFTYERSLTPKISAAASYRNMPTATFGNLKLLKSSLQVMGEDEPEGIIDDVNKITASNKALTLELCFYKGCKPGAKGLYTGLFGRYGHFRRGYHYKLDDESGENHLIPIHSNAWTLSCSLQLGAQFRVVKRIVINMQLLEFHYGKFSGDAMG